MAFVAMLIQGSINVKIVMVPSIDNRMMTWMVPVHHTLHY